MSILAHLCTDCQHPEAWHSERQKDHKYCTCCRQEPQQDKLDPTPAVLETFTLAGESEPMYQPGTTWNAGTIHAQVLCSCEACSAAYEGATA